VKSTKILGYKMLCAKWVPKILSPEYRQNCVLTACKFLERYETEGEHFLDLIVTDNETWVCHYIPELKVSLYSSIILICHQPKNSKPSFQRRGSWHLSFGTGKEFSWLILCPKRPPSML